MGNSIRRKHSSEFKTTVVMELLKGGFTGQTISDQLKQKDRLIDELYQEVGKLKYWLDWLKKRWDIPIAEKLSLIEKKE